MNIHNQVLKITLKDNSTYQVKLIGDKSRKGTLWNIHKVREYGTETWRNISPNDPDALTNRALKWAETNLGG